MDNSSNNVGANQVNRIIWLDPNMANNVMVNPEDLSIKVQFTATRKKRSIIYSGKETISTAGGGGGVTFIEGSYVNQESKQPSLTTRYTDAIALEVMNVTADKVDDFESLGIESIDIEFNTSFAPMIKIKFIDVRGNAILSQGNMSKYIMFFELPYPLFSLKVKGFYGKTVNYCLHMQRWNAAFNSDTGNFEIQAEFIGYTYALLTDMLMGLIRASVRTKKGQEKLADKKKQYGDNSNLVISIDDMLGKLNDLSFSFKKISEDDDSVQQINAYEKIEGDLNNIKGALDTLSTSMYDGQNPPNNYFRSENGGVLGLPIDDATTKKVEDAIKIYKETVTPLITNVNSNITDTSLKLNEEILNGKNAVIKITEINYLDLINEEAEVAVPIAIQKSGGAYENTDTDKDRVRIVIKQARDSIKTPLPNDTKINIYSLLRPLYHIDEKMAALKSNSNTTKEQIGEKLAKEAESTIGFEPTIRNIFRVLCISCEIFLEVLRDVSVEAETDSDKKRGEEFNKISGKINVNGKEIANKHIYPWPEYRQKKGNEGYLETWLGSAPGIIPNNIEEVVFVEEMLKCLMDVARFDNELEEQQAQEEQGGDIDSAPEQIKDPWFPISVVDTPPSGVNENPYNSLFTSESTGNVDEAIRLLLMRGFLLLGVSNYNSKLDLNIVTTYGQTEAANLYEAAKKTENGLNIIRQLQNIYGETDPVKQTDRILYYNGLQGKSTIKNPGVNEGEKKPIMSKSNNDYVYTYIINSEWDGTKFINSKDSRAYIPINNNFDGKIFYNNKTLKSIEEISKLKGSSIYVSNPKNLFNYDGAYFNEFIESKNDGSYLFKIIDKNTYESKIMAPGFASDVIEKYGSTFGGKTIKPTSFKNAYITKRDSSKAILDGINPLGGTYAALEFKDIDYNGATLGDPEKEIGEFYTSNKNNITTTLTAFYTQNTAGIEWPVGSYFALKPDNNYFDDFIPKNPKKNEKYIIPRFARQNDIRQIGSTDASSREHKSFGKQKTLLESFLSGSSKPYVPFIEFGFKEYYTHSLFGSALYNNQFSTKSKALLFLHCFPWQGVLAPGDDVSEFAMFDTRVEAPTTETGLSESEDKPTRILSIKSMFKINGAFVKAPKAWVLLIGAMLWRRRYRLKEGQDPIVWIHKESNGTFSKLIADYPGDYPVDYPSTKQFLYYSEDLFEPWGLYFNSDSITQSSVYENQQNIYTPIDRTIAGLPREVKNEFISYFENWVDDETSGFKYYQKELEIWYGRDSNKSEDAKEFNKYQAKWFQFNKLVKDGLDSNNLKSTVNTTKVKEIFIDNENIFNNYVMMSTTQNRYFQIQLELRKDTEVMDNIVGLLTDYVYLQNVNPNIWIPDNTLPDTLKKNKNYYNPIVADGNLLNKFLESFFLRINGSETKSSEVKSEEDQIQQDIFGTTDDKTIKLIIYRTLSSINDKWINGTKDSDLFAQCPGSNINKKDIELANKYRSGATKAELIDTFRFVDRAFWDIGDKFYININSVSELIRKNYNQSFFDVVNKILTDNNFNFIPLPTFVNFNDISELKTVFTPYSYNDEVGFDGTGPSFVCCYVGQTSVNLDLGVDAVYPDDGLSLNMDSSTGNANLADEYLEDFAKPLEPGEFNVPVFSVNYGQQNQNYFRSVKLDQREFTETMESLQTIEDISQGGDKSKPTYIGNNLFNVYQTRSYSAEIEMMGSAMVQPMMYFQLNNIPMFRGAYLIYKVTHSIKPHSMTTTIKGNRVKKAKTPLVDKYTMYMNLLGGSSDSTASIRSSNYSGDPNAKPESKFIDTNLNFYWLDSNGKIPTGKDTLGITNTNKQFTGLKPYNGTSNDPYLVREIAEVIQAATLKFYNANKNTSKADTIYFGDCSKLWGGPLAGHKSHQKGIDIDTLQCRYDKGFGMGSDVTDDGNGSGGDYSRATTKQWLELLFSTPYRPYTVKKDRQYVNMEGKTVTAKAGTTVKDQKNVQIIWFNDTTLQKELKEKYGSIMQTLTNHSNHLHIRFYTPLRVVEESEEGTNSRPATQANPSDSGSSSSSSKSKYTSGSQVPILSGNYDTSKDNNPFNLRPLGGEQFNGTIGKKADPGNDYFVVFDTINNGIRAGLKNLSGYFTRYNRKNIKEILETYCLGATQDYKNFVVEKMKGWNSNVTYTSTLPAFKGKNETNQSNIKMFKILCKAILKFEGGKDSDLKLIDDFDIKNL
jgi:hypothetical protein